VKTSYLETPLHCNLSMPA